MSGAPAVEAGLLAEEAGAGQGGDMVDERYEYDAPRYYDFDEGSPAGVQADGWFDTEGPKGLATPLKSTQAKEVPAAGAGTAQETQNQPRNKQGAAAGPTKHGAAQQTDTGGGGGSKGKGWRRALAGITNTKGQQQQQQQQQELATEVPPASKRTTRKAAAVAAAATGGSSEVAAPRAGKSRPAAAAAGAGAAEKKRRAPEPMAGAAAAASTSQAAASRRVAAPKQQPQHQQHGATVARSPHLHSWHRTHQGQQKTSEQLELEQVEREKAEAARLRRRNAVAVKHVLAAPVPAVAHSSKPLTEPLGLELNTAKRRRLHSMETRSMASPFKSMAEQIAAFEGRVPGKSMLAHGNSSSAADPAEPRHERQQHGGMATLTVPLSPRFATKKRVRPPRFKPREVVEEEEMAAMPKFKARPLNKRMLEDRSGHRGVPHVDTKPPTVPEPFALKTDQRAAEHSGPPSSAAQAAGGGGVFVFGAQGEGGRVTRSKAANKVASWNGHPTVPEPFSLATDARGAIKRSATSESQEAQHVRPAKRARKAPAGPFQLATDQRGAAEEARLAAIKRQREEQARHAAEFKALPLNKAALAGAWKPAPQGVAALTVPEDVVLHSDVRAAQRRQFDHAVAVKEAEVERERQEREELQQQEEEEAVRQHRKTLVHKALPLPGR